MGNNQELSQKLAYIRTFGCRANTADGEKICGMLAEMGYGFTSDLNQADLILFNTCAIRENAETRVFGNIGALIHNKRRNPDLIIAVCGCMVQQEHTAERIRQTFPFVDLIFGTHVLYKLPELLQSVIVENGKRKRIVDISGEPNIHEGLPTLRKNPLKADVHIMYGCENFCSYCVVPYVRGKERSRKPVHVNDEIRQLVESGTKEIMLLGQNVNSYGKKNGKEHGTSFAELLRQIDAINSASGEFRITYMTSHPKDLSRELIDVIAESEKISHHLHLPLQSGSNRVLAAMNRKYTIEQYKDIIAYARERIPQLSLTTDIIVGFPGETRSDFEETLSAIRDIRFDSAYTFIYSRREGTAAADFPDPVSKEEKSAWFTEMLAVLEEVGESAYQRYVGKTLRVLCDSEGRTNQGKSHSGKSREGVIVDFDVDDSSEADIIGKFVNIKIETALKWAVLGSMI